MKKLFFVTSLFATLLSYQIYAQTAEPRATEPSLVQAPALSGGLNLSVTGLYLKPTTTEDLAYATLNSFARAGRGFAFTPLATGRLEPNYNWGYGLGIGYVFPNTANDVQLTWNHFQNDDNNSINGDFAHSTVILPPFFDMGLDAAAGHVDYRYNTGALTVGQYIDVGCHTQLHFLYGAAIC